MGFLEYEGLQLIVLWYDKTVAEPHNPMFIFREASGGSGFHLLLDFPDSGTCELSSLDLVLKSWSYFQGSKETMFNYLKVELAKLLIKRQLLFLEHQGIAVGFPAQCICNYISFAGGVIKPYIIILD